MVLFGLSRQDWLEAGFLEHTILVRHWNRHQGAETSNSPDPEMSSPARWAEWEACSN